MIKFACVVLSIVLISDLWNIFLCQFSSLDILGGNSKILNSQLCSIKQKSKYTVSSDFFYAFLKDGIEF